MRVNITGSTGPNAGLIGVSITGSTGRKNGPIGVNIAGSTGRKNGLIGVNITGSTGDVRLSSVEAPDYSQNNRIFPLTSLFSSLYYL
ncbi:hypothetical protein ES703_58581 [subsurface metagenome]